MIEDTQLSNSSQKNDYSLFFNENNAEPDINRSFIDLIEQYSTLESWDTIKNALEYSPELFAESDAMKIIQHANSNFPNQDPDITFKILSVVYICLSQILKDPYSLLVLDSSFLEFFLKLPNCFSPDFDQRSILSSADIIQTLVNSYNPRTKADDSIIEAFYTIQKSIIELIKMDLFSEMSVTLLMLLLDEMIKITNEEDGPMILEFFSNCIDIEKSPSISKFAIKSCLHLFTKFPDLYNLIITEPYDYLEELMKFFDKEYGCIQYVTQIIKPLLSDEKGCILLLELGYGNSLLESFNELIKLSNNIYALQYLLEDIAIICETSQDGCAFFISNDLLENENLNECSFKIILYVLRIFYASLQNGTLTASEITIHLAVNVVTKCLESEEPDTLIKSLRIIRFLHEQSIDIIEQVKEQLEELHLAGYSEEISNESNALIKLIEKE